MDKARNIFPLHFIGNQGDDVIVFLKDRFNPIAFHKIPFFLYWSARHKNGGLLWKKIVGAVLFV